MKKGKGTSSDFFVRSEKGASTVKSFTRAASEQESFNQDDEYTSEKSTPQQTSRKPMKKAAAFTKTVQRKHNTGRLQRTIDTNASEEESDNDQVTRSKMSSSKPPFVEKPSSSRLERNRPPTSASARSSHSERSQRSFSTENDTDDLAEVEKREDYENNNDDDDDESETESSTIRQGNSPTRKRTSADLLAEESSQLLLTQGLTDGLALSICSLPQIKIKDFLRAYHFQCNVS